MAAVPLFKQKLTCVDRRKQFAKDACEGEIVGKRGKIYSASNYKMGM